MQNKQICTSESGKNGDITHIDNYDSPNVLQLFGSEIILNHVADAMDAT